MSLGMKAREKKAAEAKIRRRFRKLTNNLDERSRRLFVATEAMAFGWGGIAAAARAMGRAPSVIGAGIKEVRAPQDGTAPMDRRIRRPGAGRQKAREKDPGLLPALKALVESTTRGDSDSPLL